MSLDPILWALKDAPVADLEEWAVLVFMAERADEDGEGSFPAVGLISDRTRMSERTVQRRIHAMASRGLLARGDQRRADYLPADKRPTVWDLMIPYHWFSVIDRINEMRLERGRVPLTPEMRPKIGQAPDKPPRASRNPDGVSGSHPVDGVSGSPARGVRLTPEPPHSPYGTNSPLFPDTADAAQVQTEPERLCHLLADLVEANGSKRPTITKRWLDEARRMIDIDGRDPEKAAGLIRWTQNDPFWRGNVMAMPKFRARYDQLRLKALAEWEKAHGDGVSKANGYFRPDGSVDVVAVLGHDVWSVPGSECPAEVAEDPNAWVEWAEARAAEHRAEREVEALEELRRRGVIA